MPRWGLRRKANRNDRAGELGVEVTGGWRTMSYSPFAVANEFVRLSLPESLDAMKLVKLVYIACGWHLALGYGRLVDEAVWLTGHGPTILTLKNELRGTSELKSMVEMDGQIPSVPDAEERTRAVIAAVWKEYGRFSETELGVLTTQPGSLWDELWPAQSDGEYREVEDELVARHYVELGYERRVA